MSMAKKCDRCGGYFSPYTEKQEFGRISGFITMDGDHFLNHEVQYRDEEIDLCPLVPGRLCPFSGRSAGERRPEKPYSQRMQAL